MHSSVLCGYAQALQMWAWLCVRHAYVDVYDTAHIGVHGSVCTGSTCLWAHVRWYRLYIGECVARVHSSVCVQVCAADRYCCNRVSVQVSRYLRVCTGSAHGTPRDLVLDTQLCASGCCPTWENRCVCVCVCVTAELCWLEWPLALCVHSVLVAEPNTQDRVGACLLSCPHPHRVMTIPWGCWWCCQCCLCPYHAPQPPQLSPPLPARCRLASVAEMVRAQLRGQEQPGPAAITPRTVVGCGTGQCWAVT